MTEKQKEDLLIEWSLYGPSQKRAIISEYREKYRGKHSKEILLDFLKEKLEIEGYWKMVGLD